jgi:hypothetical protein
MPRTPNDVIPIPTVLTALATILPANTVLAAESGSVLTNGTSSLENGTAPFPAVVINQGEVSAARIEIRTWQARVTVRVDYYDRWDSQTQTLDQIWVNLDADLNRMRANVEDNPKLIVSGTAHALDVAHVALGPFVGNQINDKTFPVPVVTRSMTIQINVPPYLSAA